MTRALRIVVAIDKFRGTATQAELSRAIADVARDHGAAVRVCAMSDGGEGLLEVFGSPNRSAAVTGPSGGPVEAPWYDDGAGTAVVESARASGLALAGGADGNDPWTATSRGTGELILAARAGGAERIVVGLGGSACTDGGRGALQVLEPAVGDDRALGRCLVVCADVRTRYTDAAHVFAPQKGADPVLVQRLTRRLQDERRLLRAAHGLDPQSVVGGGAAGGLAGALACLGASVRAGFDVVAAATGLADAIAGADLVITGEGRLDASSLDGKVVGGVAELARRAGAPVVAIVGDADDAIDPPFPVHSLSRIWGRDTALTDTLAKVRELTADVLRDVLRHVDAR